MISPIDLKIVFKIDELLAEFSRFLTKPEQKFVRDLVFGILHSKRGLISEIARHLYPKSNTKTVYKRLDERLGQYSLEKAYQCSQAKMLRRVDEKCLFIFDPSEIVKPFGKKMEGLTKVRDASEKPRLVKLANGKMVETPVLKPGYPLTVAIAMNGDGEIIPIELSLYAYGSEFFHSRNEESIKVIDNLVQKTNFKPILVLDREFDAAAILRHLCGLNQRFVIRLTQNRKYKIPGALTTIETPTFTREEMIEKHCYLKANEQIIYSKNGKQILYEFEFKASFVELLSERKKKDDYRKKDDHEALTLIQMRIKKENKFPVLYLLTNTRPKTKEELAYIARAYLARWNIEEYIRFLKQHFKMEEFLVRDLGRIKNLIHAFYIATVIIHLLTDRKTKPGINSHHHLVKNSMPVSKEKSSRDFFLYSYGAGLARIVSMNKNLLLGTKKTNQKNPKENQLEFKI